MRKFFYGWTRDLHLYFGLFTSPFLIVFAASVFFLNHAGAPGSGPQAPSATFRDLEIPAGLEQAQGMDRVLLVRRILPKVGLTGEIDFIRAIPKQQRLVIPVRKPGVESTVDLNLKERTATVSSRRTGFRETVSYLHRSPGPHNAAIRGNWFWTRAWGWLADTAVYLVLFLSISGVYLWAVIRSERRIGLILLLAGMFSFAGLVYVLVA